MLYFNKTLTIFLLFIFVSINGCGLILSGNKDDLYINSKPRGAEVYINGLYMGETPLPLVLKSDKDYIVEFRKEGYERKTKIVNSSAAAGYVILDVVFAFLPVIIDASTGGWYVLDDEYCFAALEKSSDADKRKKEQADNDERKKASDLEKERINLPSSDRDKVISIILDLQKELGKLEEKRDDALKENNKYNNMANKIVTKNKYRIKEKNRYMNKALDAKNEADEINDNIFSLKEKLNSLYDLVPELRK